MLEDVTSTEEFYYGDFISRTYYFQSMHAASIILTFANLIIAYHLKTTCSKTKQTIFNTALYAIGIYAIFGAFARTGMVMTIVGSIIIFYPERLKARDIFIGIAGVVFVCAFFIYQYEHNPDFVNRIFDQGENGHVDRDRIGSGRLMFAEKGFLLYTSGNFLQQFFGYGNVAVTEHMARHTGMAIGLHNGFADAFVMNGLLGFFFFIKMLLAYISYVKLRIKTNYSRLLLAFFIAFLSCLYTQGNIGFGMDLFTALVVATAL